MARERDLRLRFVKGQAVVVDVDDASLLPGDRAVVRRCGGEEDIACYYEVLAANIPQGCSAHHDLNNVTETCITEIIGRIVEFTELISDPRRVPVDFRLIELRP